MNNIKVSNKIYRDYYFFCYVASGANRLMVSFIVCLCIHEILVDFH